MSERLVHTWRAMTLDDVPAVVEMERPACAHPLHAWTPENYRSSLASGYWMHVACDTDGDIVAVCVAMPGVDELHLLNIAVARQHHGRGLARWILAQLTALCQERALAAIWLEVRPSNQVARALYCASAYTEVSVRKQYYPAPQGREDAIVMKREVPHAPLV